MKTLKLLVFGFVFLLGNSLLAQVNVAVNIGTPPAWGPAEAPVVEYYYIPDVEAYYDIQSSRFIYFGDGKWVRAKTLPRKYRNYDLYNGYKVVLTDYHGKTPYTHFHQHKVKYHKGYKGKHQKTIGVKADKKHSKHGKHHKGKGKGHKKHDGK